MTEQELKNWSEVSVRFGEQVQEFRAIVSSALLEAQAMMAGDASARDADIVEFAASADRLSGQMVHLAKYFESRSSRLVVEFRRLSSEADSGG